MINIYSIKFIRGVSALLIAQVILSRGAVLFESQMPVTKLDLPNSKVNPDLLTEDYINTQKGWNYGDINTKNTIIPGVPAYMGEVGIGKSGHAISRSCNIHREDVDQLAERVFLTQIDIPELSDYVTWQHICTFVIDIIDNSPANFMRNCKSKGSSTLLGKKATKIQEVAILKLCKSLPQFMTCNGNDDAADNLAISLMTRTYLAISNSARSALNIVYFCFVAVKSINQPSKSDYLSSCRNGLNKLMDLEEFRRLDISSLKTDEICKSTWVYNTKCQGTTLSHITTNIAFDFFIMLRKHGITNVMVKDMCRLVGELLPSLNIIYKDHEHKVKTKSKYKTQCPLLLMPFIENDIRYLDSMNNQLWGQPTKFYSRKELLRLHYDRAKNICSKMHFYDESNWFWKVKGFLNVNGKKDKKVEEKVLGESIYDLYVDFKYALETTSRRRLGWSIDLPLPESEEYQAMASLGYSLNTVDVGSLRNPQYIRMLAILKNKRYIMPKTAYEIWRDTILVMGIDIIDSYTTSKMSSIISRPTNDILDLGLNCGSNNEEIDALALELLSAAHENSLTRLKFKQFCHSAKNLLGIRNEDFFSSCVDSIRYLPEIDQQTGDFSGQFSILSNTLAAKLCRSTLRWEAASVGLSYAALIIPQNINNISNLKSSKSDELIIKDNQIYSYVIKTATRSALERAASLNQVCKNLQPLFMKKVESDEPLVVVEKIQQAANLLFRSAVKLIDHDKHLAYILSGGSKIITFESFCALAMALSKIERRFHNVECARNIRLMFTSNVMIRGKLKKATIKSRSVGRICITSPFYEYCGDPPNKEVDEIAFDLLLGAQRFRLTSITYRHLCGVVRNIRRYEIKSFMPSNENKSMQFSSFFNSDCIYGLRTLSVAARYAESICSNSNFWVMCGNYIDAPVDALAAQLYAGIVQNTDLNKVMTVGLLKLAQFCPIADVLINEIDTRYFNRECINALAAIGIMKEFGQVVCQDSRFWQGTCAGILDFSTLYIQTIDPIAGGLYNSAQDLGYLDIAFVDFCTVSEEIKNLREVTESGQVLEGHKTSMFSFECPRILGSALQTISDEYATVLERATTRREAKIFSQTVSAENYEKATMICQHFFTVYDEDYGASQVEDYKDVHFRSGIISKRPELFMLREHGKKAVKELNPREYKSLAHPMALIDKHSIPPHRYDWANLLAQKFFVPASNFGHYGLAPIGGGVPRFTPMGSGGSVMIPTMEKGFEAKIPSQGESLSFWAGGVFAPEGKEVNQDNLIRKKE
ncbi:hypothetical protein cand_036160 [Cryptosporidium andersoni]|uniref:Uncharacterized protein n=1 Tax=Cryptosporidium andersoni TaxID=117008 RepID=A0A1J4MYD5_9CRYT|nr:hypothetical protein cand_036160 [Cryptosporidium andersoni]